MLIWGVNVQYHLKVCLYFVNWVFDEYVTFFKAENVIWTGWLYSDITQFRAFSCVCDVSIHVSYFIIAVLECKYSNLCDNNVYFMYSYVVANSEITFIKDSKWMIVVLVWWQVPEFKPWSAVFAKKCWHVLTMKANEHTQVLGI